MLKYILVVLACILIDLGATQAECSTLPLPISTLNTAIKRYEDIHRVRNLSQYIVIVNFALPDTVPRLWVYDVDTRQLILQTYVAHGSGSGHGAYATSFSNQLGSRASSLGASLTAETYEGHNGLSLRLEGLDHSNSNEYVRSIVIHGATYVGQGQTGHSWGCLAVPYQIAPSLIRLLTSTGNPSLVVVENQ